KPGGITSSWQWKSTAARLILVLGRQGGPGMKDIIVIGAGNIGSTIAGMLARTGDYRVTLADRSAQQLAEAPAAGVEHLVLDVNDAKALASAMAGKFAAL